jgi:hypothetical protein
VYLAHAEQASDARNETYTTTRRRIAERSGVSLRKVATIHSLLRDLGLLEWTQQRVEGANELGPSTYTLLDVSDIQSTQGAPCPTSGIPCPTSGTDSTRSCTDGKHAPCTVLKECTEECTKESAKSGGSAAGGRSTGNKPQTKLFTDLWTAEYKSAHRCGYVFQGPKDGKAAANLLKHAELSPQELVQIAKDAWANPTGFNCKQAASIAGFASRFNEIRSELKTLAIGSIAPPLPKHDSKEIDITTF